MDEEMQAIDDMENNNPDDPAAAAGGVAASAQPDRHGFWAWRERVMRRNLQNNNPIVAAAEPSRRGRVVFFCFAVFMDVAIFAVSALLLILCDGYHPTTMAGRALQVAGRVAGISCIVLGSVGYFAIGIFISEALDLEGPRIIDSFI